MKTITLLFTIMIAVAGCHPNPANYSHPVGYVSCHSDNDCKEGEFCSFVGVDTYPVCRK